MHNGQGGREGVRKGDWGLRGTDDSSGPLLGFRETSFQANTEQVEEGRDGGGEEGTGGFGKAGKQCP